MLRLKRLNKEKTEIPDKVFKIKSIIDNNTITQVWKFVYPDRQIYINVRIPEQYPFEKPVFIYAGNKICLESFTQWHPKYHISDILHILWHKL